MNRHIVRLSVFAVFVVLTVTLATLVFAQEPPDSWTGQEQMEQGSDSNPAAEPEIVIPERYRSSRSATASAVATASVYFTPQDENTSATILFLYNTSTTTATVGVKTFSLTGSQVINTDVDIPPGDLVRICSDSVEEIGSWSDVILINFRTTSAYGELIMPAGVKVDGYVAWNGSNPYDPLAAVPTLPLRFSSDPATVFLPRVQN